MRSLGKNVLTVIAVFALISTCLILIPSSSATDYTYGTYGRADKYTYTDVDQKIKDATGKSIDEWVDKLSADMTDYDITKFEPNFTSEVSIRRDTSLNGHEFTIKDHISFYIEAHFDINVNGNFPGAGTYDAKEGEGSLQLLERVFTEHGQAKKTDHSMTMDIDIYIDADIDTKVDINTGDITSSYVNIRFLMNDHETRDISIAIESNEAGDPLFLSIDYSRVNTDSDLYAGFEIGLTIEGLKAFSSSETEWEVRPVVKEHVYRSAVSSDLAGSVWMMAVDSMDGKIGNVQLPELILKIIGSGGRMMDVFETIKSLTSTDLPDVSFTATLKASDFTDADGFEYCKLESLKDGGPVFQISTGGYVLDLVRLAGDIPDYIISDKVKIAMEIVFLALGWNHLIVGDISDDEETQGRCSGISQYVDGKIGTAEETHYSTPSIYFIIAIAGLAVCIILGLLIWRRVL